MDFKVYLRKKCNKPLPGNTIYYEIVYPKGGFGYGY